MRSFAAIAKALLLGAITAGTSLALGGCGPDYAIFKVHVASTTSPRNDIVECRMTITDENGKLVLDHYPLQKVFGQTAGEVSIKYGCEGGLTNADIGFFSFSTSRSSGRLTFRVDATDDGGKVVQTGSNTGDVKPFPPEIGVEVAISKP